MAKKSVFWAIILECVVLIDTLVLIGNGIFLISSFSNYNSIAVFAMEIKIYTHEEAIRLWQNEVYMPFIVAEVICAVVLIVGTIPPIRCLQLIKKTNRKNNGGT